MQGGSASVSLSKYDAPDPNALDTGSNSMPSVSMKIVVDWDATAHELAGMPTFTQYGASYEHVQQQDEMISGHGVTQA